jgi:hypothetical protein
VMADIVRSRFVSRELFNIRACPQVQVMPFTSTRKFGTISITFAGCIANSMLNGLVIEVLVSSGIGVGSTQSRFRSTEHQQDTIDAFSVHSSPIGFVAEHPICRGTGASRQAG